MTGDHYQGERRRPLHAAVPTRENRGAPKIRGISVITLGDDERAMSEALERIARVENELPQSLRYVLERVGDSNPAFVARIDLAGVVRDLAPLVDPESQDRPDLGSEPLHFTYYGGIDGRTWRLGFRTDLSQIGTLFK